MLWRQWTHPFVSTGEHSSGQIEQRYFRYHVILLSVKAIIISLSEDLDELVLLANTLDIGIERNFVQKRRHSHPRLFVGEGKLDEIADYVDSNEIDAALINDIIKPSQHYTLEKRLGIQCIDRIGLILDIFKMRASSTESKLQIEHAMLRYEIPIVREWIHKSRSGEHPGFLTGGEYGIDAYHDLIKKKITKVGRTLEKVRKDRSIKRALRRKMGCVNLTIMGYTNAGKSSLFNVLTDSDAFVDDKYFSTLSVKSRRMDKRAKTIIITDTIGFIEGMPPWLIESFHASMEEIADSDCVLWVFDGSDGDDDIENKFGVCWNALNTLTEPIIIPVLNKVDLLNEEDVDDKMGVIEGLTGKIPSAISASNRDGIDELRQRILGSLRPKLDVRITIKSGPKTQNILSWLFDHTDVVEVTYGQKVLVNARCEEKDVDVIRARYGRSIQKVKILT
jgi:GTP-binding protein HflX